jgi:hypothetical protein
MATIVISSRKEIRSDGGLSPYLTELAINMFEVPVAGFSFFNVSAASATALIAS